MGRDVLAPVRLRGRKRPNREHNRLSKGTGDGSCFDDSVRKDGQAARGHLYLRLCCSVDNSISVLFCRHQVYWVNRVNRLLSYLIIRVTTTTTLHCHTLKPSRLYLFKFINGYLQPQLPCHANYTIHRCLISAAAAVLKTFLHQTYTTKPTMNRPSLDSERPIMLGSVCQP